MIRILFGIALLAAVGCATHGLPRGSVMHVEQQEKMNDFEFAATDGARQMLSDHLGDFTVLSFTRCDRDTHGPAISHLREILADHDDVDNVRVVGIDIHWSEGGCQTHPHCHLVGSDSGVGTICDATGSVHRLYGGRDEDWVYAIGSDGTLVLSSPMSDRTAFRSALRAFVGQLNRERQTVEDYLDPDA